MPKGEAGAALLLYQTEKEIRWAHLNGSAATISENYTSPANVNLLGLDFDHLNSTVCWISHDNVSSMRCAIAHDMQHYWEMPQPYLYSFEGWYFFLCLIPRFRHVL